MLTARRIRHSIDERQAGTEPVAARPDAIPTHEHDRIVSDLKRQHAREMADLKAMLQRNIPSPMAQNPATAPEPAKPEQPKPSGVHHGRGHRRN